MKILLLSWRCIKNPAAGGSELYFHELAKRWVAWGNEVTWFSPMFKGGKKEELCDGIRIVRRGGRASTYPLAFLEYLAGRIGKDYDVILDVENGFPFFSKTYAGNKCVVLHVHHPHKEQWFREFRFPISWTGYFLENALMPIVYRGSKIITISESSADEIIKMNISSERAEIVNPGIEFYKRKKIEKNKAPTVLFLNRIKKYKGIDTFLEAAKIMINRNPKLVFWVAGSGDELPAAREFAERNRLKNVVFFGRVSEEKKRELMRKAWAFVNPSIKEGWGIVNIEANYEGTPAIGADVPGTKDSIVNNKTGLLFFPENSSDLVEKIERLINDKELRRKLEKGAMEWASKFSWDVKAREYLDILNRCSIRHKRS